METQAMEKIYEKIASKINEIIPEEWDKVYLFSQVNEHAAEVYFYYYPKGKTKPVYLFDITELFEYEEHEFDELRYALINLFEELWQEFKNSGQEVWTNLTFILESTGRFKVDYDYSDLSEVDDYEQQLIWEYRYLGIMSEDEDDKKVVEEYIKNNQVK